jgi:hypothetical protein
MESLAFLVFIIISALFLCGPVAIALALNKWSVLAVLVGACACWLGIFWFVTVYTGWKYLGLVSAACGLYAMYKTAKNML